jgi:predicted transcriptional regulator
MLVSGFGITVFLVLWIEKRKRLRKVKRYEDWFTKKVKEGLQDEKVGKLIAQEKVERTFEKYE